MTTGIPVSDTGPSKGSIIDMAFEDCRLSGFDFDRTPEENLMALRRLNTMMSEWPWSNVGYASPDFGEGSTDELSNVPPDAVHGVSQALAMRLMTAFGKTPPETFRVTAAQSIAYVKGQYATVPAIGFAPGTLRGRGAKTGYYHDNPYFPVPE
jgi:hypothetical protein